MKPPGGRSGLLANLFDEIRHVVDLLHGYHMKIRIVLLRHRKRHGECTKSMLRPVIGVQNVAEHRSAPASFGFSCDRSKLRDFPATVGRLFKLGVWQKVAREIERIGDHRWDHGTRDYCCDK